MELVRLRARRDMSGSGRRGTRRWRHIAALLVLVPTLAFAMPGIASASSYGIATFPGQAFTGAHAEIMSVHLNPGDYSTDFVDDDMWMVRGSGHYWIESGLIMGHFCTHSPPPYGSPCDTTTTLASRHFFWTDSRPNGGFNAHVGPLADLNTYYDDDILYEGSDDWYVSVGPFSGTSSGWYDYGVTIETGTETTNPNTTVSCASQHNLAWYDSNGTYYQGFVDAEGPAQLSPGGPPFPYWAHAYDWLRDYDNSTC